MAIDQDNGWEACPEGFLRQTNRQYDRLHRTRALRQVATGMVAGLLIATVGYLLVLLSDANTTAPDTLVCDQVISILPRYIASQLSEDLTRRVEIHLSTCDRCKKTYRDMLSTVKEEMTYAMFGRLVHTYTAGDPSCPENHCPSFLEKST